MNTEPKHSNSYKTLRSVLSIIACVALLATACGQPSDDSSQTRGASEQPVARASGRAGSAQKQRQADFLNRIRQSDPQFQNDRKSRSQ